MKSEAQIEKEIMVALSQKGFLVLSINVASFKIDNRFISTGVPKGYPDLTAIKDGKVYFIEVKTPTGKPSKHQLHFLKVARERYGCVAGICRSVQDALELVENG